MKNINIFNVNIKETGLHFIIFYLYKKYKSSDTACVWRDPRPQVRALFRHGPRDGRAFHFAFVVYYNAGVVLKINKNAVLPAEWFALPDHDCRHYLLTKFGLTLLHGGHYHVTGASSWQSVQATANTLYCDHI